MITSITNLISKGLINQVSGTSFTWWKTPFNMPTPNLFDNNSGWIRYQGPFSYPGQATSFDLSGFSPGFEICVFSSIFDWENDTANSVTLNEYIWTRWADPSWTTIFWGSYGDNINMTLPAYNWTESMFCTNTGVASWEVASNGIYHVGASSTGNYPISEHTADITFSNVPDVTQLSYDDIGHIWIEGNNLCFINANRWKHTIYGTQVSTTPGTDKAGYIWIDTSNDLHWIGGNGYNYKTPWKVKQFASFFSNSATSTVYAGTDKAGYIWMDDEFGFTHLSYIGYDGYKYLIGAGDSPYV